MVSRRAFVLSCDLCGTDAGRVFRSHKQVAAWMRRRGWKFWNLQDWCPTCVMRDRLKQLADANSPARPTPTNGDT